MKMKVQVQQDLRTRSGVLTTEHAQSSYGMPILLIDGIPHGAGDLGSHRLAVRVTRRTEKIIRAADAAGFNTVEE